MTELPQAFLNRMEQMLGEEEFRLFLSSYDRTPVKALRVNTLKVSVAEFRTLSPFPLRPVPWCAEGFIYPDVGETESAREPENARKMKNAGGAADSAENAGRSEAAGEEAGETEEYNSDALRPGRHVYHEAGLYYIQEPSAMAVAALSGAQPGERILDLCAAPGGKSTQLAAMLAGQGLLVSNEIHSQRAHILSQNVERMGIRNAIVTNETPERLAEQFGGYFDRVIVDAPCSGEGMFRKDAEAAAMWSEELVEHCAARQQDILEEAAKMLRPGGTLVYSTCTFAPQEDEESIGVFVAKHPEFRVVDLPAALGQEKMCSYGFETGRPEWCRKEIAQGTEAQKNAAEHRLILDARNTSSGEDSDSQAVPDAVRAQLPGTIRLFPHKLEGEGHFVAVLRKQGIAQRQLDTGRQQEAPAKNKKRRTEPQDLEKTFAAFAAETLGADDLVAGGKMVRFGDELYMEPCDLPLQGLKVLRPGLDLGTFRKNRFEPAHALALSLRKEEVKQFYELQADQNQAAAWLRGESVSCAPSLKGWVLVTVDGYSLGWGKAAGGMLKNHYPKGLRKNY